MPPTNLTERLAEVIQNEFSDIIKHGSWNHKQIDWILESVNDDFITKQEAEEQVAAVVESNAETVRSFKESCCDKGSFEFFQNCADFIRSSVPTEILAQLKERVHLAALKEAAKVACEYCKANLPIEHHDHNYWHIKPDTRRRPCKAQAIRALMEKGKEGE